MAEAKRIHEGQHDRDNEGDGPETLCDKHSLTCTSLLLALLPQHQSCLKHLPYLLLTSCFLLFLHGEIMLDIIDRAEVEHSMPMISGLVIDSNICVKPSIEICGFKVPVAVQK